MRFWKPRTVPGNPLVGIACATWLNSVLSPRLGQLLGLTSAFESQTYPHWHMEVTHDGPVAADAKNIPAIFNKGKLTFVETTERKRQFGHPHRQAAIDRLLERGCEWIALTNDDNYYAPVYLEWMLSEAIKAKAKFVYCDMIHSHKLWKPLTTEIRRGKIDLGGFLVHADVAKKIKFDQTHFAADWDYISRVRVAAGKVAKVGATLFTHN